MPRGTSRQKIDAGGVPAEWISSPDASPERVMLYLHGGGWILGLYNNHRWLAAHLCLICQKPKKP